MKPFAVRPLNYNKQNEFNLDLFLKCVDRVYPQATTSFTIDEVKEVFKLYFHYYEEVTSKKHPVLKKEQIVSLISSMDVLDPSELALSYDKSNTIWLIPAWVYEDIIPLYFEQMYDGYLNHNTDLNINHFMNNNIRLYRFVESVKQEMSSLEEEQGIYFLRIERKSSQNERKELQNTLREFA